jgi:N-acetylglucosamine-6-phosphate deacetylase
MHRTHALTARPAAGTVRHVSADRGIVVVGGRDPSGVPCSLAAIAGRIVEGEPLGTPVRVEAGGLLVAPGFVDLQVNGAAGIDLTSEPEGIWAVAAALPRFGVTSFLPTLVTSPREVVDRALAVLAAGPPAGWVGARPLGLHLEGPMISPHRRGAHAARHVVAPSPAAIAGWSADAGVAMVTLAPELSGAMTVIAELVARGVVVSAGHTNADARVARDAVAAGVRAVTHLFNAMAPLAQRDPGLVGATLAGLPVVAALIADGVHLDPDVLTLAWRALGPDRRMLASDATAALGAPPGSYRLGELAIASDGVRVRDPATGALAGSAAGIDGGVRNVAAIAGCARAEAIAAATSTPARLLGRGELGALGAGTPADLVLLDADLRVATTIVGGVVAHRRDAG